MDETDLSKITDIKELESLGYKQVKTIESLRNGLQLIEQRIAELEAKPPKEAKK